MSHSDNNTSNRSNSYALLTESPEYNSLRGRIMTLPDRIDLYFCQSDTEPSTPSFEAINKTLTATDNTQKKKSKYQWQFNYTVIDFTYTYLQSMSSFKRYHIGAQSVALPLISCSSSLHLPILPNQNTILIQSIIM